MGLVLRETAYKDSSKILTVLTDTEGKLTVSAKGALRKNSKLTAVTQLLVFSEMTLYQSRDRWTLTEARSIEQFAGLRDDLAFLALGAYFAELTEAVSDEDSPNPELLPLILNGLYALGEKIKTPQLIKPAFEFRLMSVSGFTPIVGQCATCDADIIETAFLDFAGGTIRCGDCTVGGGDGGARLNSGALRALRYILECEPKRLFSFNLSGETLRQLTVAAEGYLLTHLDRGFRTLDYYKGVTI